MEKFRRKSQFFFFNYEKISKKIKTIFEEIIGKLWSDFMVLFLPSWIWFPKLFPYLCPVSSLIFFHSIEQKPSKIKQPKAVIVLIHGGSLLWGSGSEDVYGSPEYVMHRDIVYVTLNFRLHILGKVTLHRWL